MGGALGVSVLSHVGFLLAFLVFLRVAPDSVTNAILPDNLPKEIVWLVQPGPAAVVVAETNNRTHPKRRKHRARKRSRCRRSRNPIRFQRPR
jgi:hypothetical protein